MKPEDVLAASEVSEGWHALITDLVVDLNQLVPGWEPDQIKEKFGGLRFYAALPDSVQLGAAQERIRAAESASYRTCEVCGEPGTLRNDMRWMRTLCDRDAAERS